MSLQENRAKLEAAGWDCQWLETVERIVGRKKVVRRLEVVATKNNYGIRVSGKPEEAENVWAEVYVEAKMRDLRSDG